jgi:hypothetical protein
MEYTPNYDLFIVETTTFYGPIAQNVMPWLELVAMGSKMDRAE